MSTASRRGASGAGASRARRTNHPDLSYLGHFAPKSPGPLFERPTRAAPAVDPPGAGTDSSPRPRMQLQFRPVPRKGRELARYEVLHRGQVEGMLTELPTGIWCTCPEFVRDWECRHVDQALGIGVVRLHCQGEAGREGGSA